MNKNMIRMPTVLAMALVAVLSACGESSSPSADRPAESGSIPDAATPSGSALGDVGGRVLDASGKPRAGVPVIPRSLDDPSKPIPEMMVVSDTDGSYTWRLSAGRYELKAAGAEPVTVVVKAADAVGADLKVKRK